jgi:hypothetical protein
LYELCRQRLHLLISLTKLCIAKSTNEGHDARQDPDDEGESSGAGMEKNALGRNKDPRPNNDPYNDGDPIKEPKLLLQLNPTAPPVIFLELDKVKSFMRYLSFLLSLFHAS